MTSSNAAGQVGWLRALARSNPSRLPPLLPQEQAWAWASALPDGSRERELMDAPSPPPGLGASIVIGPSDASAPDGAAPSQPMVVALECGGRWAALARYPGRPSDTEDAMACYVVNLPTWGEALACIQRELGIVSMVQEGMLDHLLDANTDGLRPSASGGFEHEPYETLALGRRQPDGEPACWLGQAESGRFLLKQAAEGSEEAFDDLRDAVEEFMFMADRLEALHVEVLVAGADVLEAGPDGLLARSHGSSPSP